MTKRFEGLGGTTAAALATLTLAAPTHAQETRLQFPAGLGTLSPQAVISESLSTSAAACAVLPTQGDLTTIRSDLIPEFYRQIQLGRVDEILPGKATYPGLAADRVYEILGALDYGHFDKPVEAFQQDLNSVNPNISVDNIPGHQTLVTAELILTEVRACVQANTHIHRIVEQSGEIKRMSDKLAEFNQAIVFITGLLNEKTSTNTKALIIPRLEELIAQLEALKKQARRVSEANQRLGHRNRDLENINMQLKEALEYLLTRLQNLKPKPTPPDLTTKVSNPL